MKSRPVIGTVPATLFTDTSLIVCRESGASYVFTATQSCVLEAKSQLVEYRKIADEILERMPDENRSKAGG